MNSLERVHTALRSGIFAALLLTPLATLHAGDRPNILLILADDLKYHDLGVTPVQGIHHYLMRSIWAQYQTAKLPKAKP